MKSEENKFYRIGYCQVSFLKFFLDKSDKDKKITSVKSNQSFHI